MINLLYLVPVSYIIVITTVSQYFAYRIQRSKVEAKEETNLSDSQRKKFEIDTRIRELQVEADKLNSPDTFVKHSVLTRKIVKLQRDSMKLEEKIREEGGEVNPEIAMDKSLKELKKSGSNNKLLVALILSWVLSRYECVYDFNADSLYPIELFLGKKNDDGKWKFCTTFFFAFLVVRFSTRLDRLVGFGK